MVLVGTNRDAHKYKHGSKPPEFNNLPELSSETCLERMDIYFERMEIEDPSEKNGYLEDYINSSLTADVPRFKEKPYEEFRKELVRVYQTLQSVSLRIAEFRQEHRNESESLQTYMERLRLGTKRAFPHYNESAFECELAITLLKSLNNPNSATSIYRRHTHEL